MDRSDLYPALVGFPPAVAVVPDAPSDVTDMRLVADARGWERLPECRSLARLWCFRVNQQRLAVITQCRSLKRLYLEGIRAPLHGLAELTNLVVLSLDSAPLLSSLDEIPTHAPLEGLSITNAPKVSDLTPIRDRHQLRALNVSGGMWSRMTVDSLDPLGGLTRLRSLDLLNLKVRDESLEALGSLVGLKELNLANFYPLREFARLSARLKHTQCSWFRPTVDLPNVRCPRCGKTSLVVLTGKGTRTMCRSCDTERIRRHEDLFQELAA